MDDIRRFLREFNQLWVRPDVDAILANVTDDIRFIMAGKQPIEGKADFRSMFDDMPGHSSDMRLEIEDILVEGDRAVVSGLIRMADSDGDCRNYAFCDVYRLEGRLVAELKAYVVEADGN